MESTSLLGRIDRWMATPWYWLAILLGGVALEAIALFYQHVLDEPPCVLCIHARLWTLGMIVAGSLGLLLYRRWPGRLFSQSVLIVSLAGLLERSWVALQVERGTYEGLCGMDPGFPDWLPLDDWFPNFLQVWTMCGYSPNFLFGLTMVEALTYGTALVLLVALAGAVVIFAKRSS